MTADAQTHTELLSAAFSALSDPTRREIVVRLADGDATVTELAEPFDMSIQAVSKHLKVLEQSGLVSKTKVAQSRPAHLEAEVLSMLTGWLERYRRQAEERYTRLDELLASMNEEEA